MEPPLPPPNSRCNATDITLLALKVIKEHSGLANLYLSMLKLPPSKKKKFMQRPH